MTEDALQRDHSLREVFHGLRWIDEMVHDLRAVLRLAAAHTEEPLGAIFNGHTL
jgi:hypothetical protein